MTSPLSEGSFPECCLRVREKSWKRHHWSQSLQAHIAVQAIHTSGDYLALPVCYNEFYFSALHSFRCHHTKRRENHSSMKIQDPSWGRHERTFILVWDPRSLNHSPDMSPIGADKWATNSMGELTKWEIYVASSGKALGLHLSREVAQATDEAENAKSRERHRSQTIGIATCSLKPYHNLSHVLCIFYVSPPMEHVLWVVWFLCTHGKGRNNMHISRTSTLREATRMTFQLSWHSAANLSIRVFRLQRAYLLCHTRQSLKVD